MPVVTHGRISVAPMRVTTDFSLESVLDILKADKPDAAKLSPGWGSLGDDVSLLGEPGGRAPHAGTPGLVEGDDLLPTRIEARAYWWEVDREVLRYVGAQDRRAPMRLTAADVFISTEADGQLQVLVSTRNEHQIKAYVKPMLDDVFDPDAGNASVHLDTSAMDLINPSFFLWLLYRSQKDPQIDDDLSIEDMRAANSVDSKTRATQVSRGVGMDRGEVLALVMQPTTTFGPVKVLLRDTTSGMQIDCEIAHRGEFGLIKKETKFLAAAPPEVSDEYRNVLFVLTYAHQIYPRLVEAWQNDTSWEQGGEANFREECRQMMRDALA